MVEVKIPLTLILRSMNETSWSILELIEKRPELNFYEIRKESNLSQEKTYKELSRLEGGALITGVRRLSDNRILSYEITEYGKTALSTYKDINI